jgi:hypothetical protein
MFIHKRPVSTVPSISASGSGVDRRDVFRSVHLLHDIEPRPGDPAAARASRIHCVETTGIAQHDGVPQANRERSRCARPPSRPRHPHPVSAARKARSGYSAVISRTAGRSARATANRDRVRACIDSIRGVAHRNSQLVSGNVRTCQSLTRWKAEFDPWTVSGRLLLTKSEAAERAASGHSQ